MIAPSICIPRVFDNSITKDKIYQVFHNYNWGPISRIDLVHKNNNIRAFNWNQGGGPMKAGLGPQINVSTWARRVIARRTNSCCCSFRVLV